MTALHTTLKPQVPDTIEHSDRWREQARCASDRYDPEQWFPVGDNLLAQQQAEEAVAVCRACPVRTACLDWAMTSREDTGVWGGLTKKERAAIRRRKQRTPVPVPATRTVQQLARDAYDTYTVDVGGGHREWRGGPIRIDGVMHSPKQATWVAVRGARPTGALITQCGRRGCVTPDHQHQTRSTNGRKAA
ncbi:WhiB family transcriptional regulator [Streptomyces halstedii]|uniref:WhiB family transcriptional regulator n=1 Tax=Streptomyces halstedii TaxID=1944 RepID=UPI0036587010